MNRTRRPLNTLAALATLAVGAFLCRPVARAATINIDDQDTGFNAAGTTFQLLVTSYSSFNGKYARTTAVSAGDNLNAVYTYTPSAVAFDPGTYDLYVQYVVGVTGHTPEATYTVNHASGSAAVTLNQRQNAGQGASAAQLANANASGFYYLGRFTLDNASNLTVTNTTSETTNNRITADLFHLRTPDEGVLVDPQSSRVTATAGAGSFAVNPTAAGIYSGISANYIRSSAVGNGVSIDLVDAAGVYSVAVSWAAHATSSGGVTYLLDLDGDLGTTGDQTVVTLNQQLFADQSAIPGANPEFSGFYDLGQFALTASSILTVANIDTDPSTFLTIDMTKLTYIPEPASLLLLGLGGLLIAGRRRRG